MHLHPAARLAPVILLGEVELTEADKQRAAKYREASRAVLQGHVTKLVPDNRLEQLIQSGGAA